MVFHLTNISIQKRMFRFCIYSTLQYINIVQGRSEWCNIAVSMLWRNVIFSNQTVISSWPSPVFKVLKDFSLCLYKLVFFRRLQCGSRQEHLYEIFQRDFLLLDWDSSSYLDNILGKLKPSKHLMMICKTRLTWNEIDDYIISTSPTQSWIYLITNSNAQ